MLTQQHHKFLTEYKVKRELVEGNIEILSDDIHIWEKQLAELKCGQDIMTRLGISSQKDITGVIEELITQALVAVFGPDFSFKVEDGIKGNAPVTNFYVIEKGHKLDIEDESGGGMADLCALCLRIVFWAIETPRKAPVIILDEPLRFLDGVRLEDAGHMVSRLSELMGIQFIIISSKVGEDRLVPYADTIHIVSKSGAASYIECIKEAPLCKMG